MDVLRKSVSDAVVWFLLRTSRLVDGLDTHMFAALLPWPDRDWAFGRVVFAASNDGEDDLICG